MNSKFAGLALGTESAARMTLLHPITRVPLKNIETGEPAWIDLLSASSNVGRAHERAINDKAIKAQGRLRTAEEIEADMIDKLAKLTRGWSLVTLEGAPLDVPFSEDGARELYAMAEVTWIADQVLRFVSDLGNFPKVVSAS